jgi:hypothetical protein
MAKEYQLDEVNKTATLVWSFAHPDVNGKPVYFFATGSVQRLANGNTFIDGGYDTSFDDQPNFWEVTPDGTIVWQATLHETKNVISYRARKFDWRPCARVTYRMMRATNITNTSAKLSWAPATGAALYHLRYRKQGTQFWNAVNSVVTFKQLENLSPNTVYEWQIMTSCTDPDTSSGFTPIRSFKTNPMKPELGSVEKYGVMIYPNPASEKVFITLNDDAAENASVKIFNMLGQEVYKSKFPDENSALEISLTSFLKGSYFIEVKNRKEIFNGKLIVN